jgi:hypothetical protein
LRNGTISVLQKIPQKWDPLTNAKVPRNGITLPYRAIEGGPGRRPVLSYWLIAKNENGRIEVLTALLADGEEAIPVFSYEEEAELFLHFREAGSGWRVRESTAGELISVLCGPCAGAKEVSLDPLPEMVAEGTLGLVNLSRKHFVNLVLKRGQQPPTGRQDNRGLTQEPRPHKQEDALVNRAGVLRGSGIFALREAVQSSELS